MADPTTGAAAVAPEATGAAAGEATANTTAGAATNNAGGGGLRGMGRSGFQNLRATAQAQSQEKAAQMQAQAQERAAVAQEQAQEKAAQAKQQAQEQAARAKAEADRLSEENEQFREARAIAEAKAAQAKAEGQRIADDNKAVMQQNAEAAKAAQAKAQEMRSLPPGALKQVAAQEALAAKDQGAALYQQNRELIDRNKAAADAAKREVERSAQEAKAQAVVLGQQGAAAGMAAGHTAINIARGEFEQRVAKVREQEAKLNAAAAEVEKREKQLSLLLQKSEPNWPRKFCCIEPMVHHDIVGDIPFERQPFMKKAYFNYFFTCVLLFLNFVMALAMLLIENKQEENEETGKMETKKTNNDGMEQHVGISVIYWLLGTPLAFIVWYWPTYKSCGTGSSTQYIMSFIGLGIALAFDIFVAIGPLGYGGTGIIWAMTVNEHKGDKAFIPAIIMAILWIVQSVFFGWMIWRVYKYYQSDKASLARAKTEMFANEVKSALS